MTLCEHLQCLEAAAKFAQAAAQEIAQLKETAPKEHQEDLLAREGRIWANLFTYAVYSRQYQVQKPYLSWSLLMHHHWSWRKRVQMQAQWPAFERGNA